MNKIKRSISILTSIVIIIAASPMTAPPVFAGAMSTTDYITTSTAAGTVLNDGCFYIVQGSPTITAGSGVNGLNVATGASVTIYIPTGSTLTVKGGAGATGIGGGAGIALPSDARLFVTGHGTLNVTGGAGGNAGNGIQGDTSYFGQGGWPAKPGIAKSSAINGHDGRGGNGSGGGGAAIGGRGGGGGNGGAAIPPYFCAQDIVSDYPGKAGNAGSTGTQGGNMGTMYALGTVNINATAGTSGNAGAGGAAGSELVNHDVGGYYCSAGGDGGGGGGGASTSSSAIGGGGGGGGGGGSGSSGSVNASSKGPYKYSGGSGGAGGTAGGTATSLNSLYASATGGAMGAAGPKGANGTLYKSAGATVSARTADATAETHSDIQFNVTFDKQGGNGTISNITATLGLPITSVTTPTYAGYTFQGFYTGTSGAGIKVYNSDGTANTPDWITPVNTLYASWKPVQYSVVYDPNGADNATTQSSISADYNSTIPLSGTNGLTKANRVQIGWNTRNDGKGTRYLAGATFTIPFGNQTLYADWKLPGDISDDDQLSIRDAWEIQRRAAGLITYSTADLIIGDMDGDGDITTLDARKVARKAARLE